MLFRSILEDLERLLSCGRSAHEWSMFKGRLEFTLGLPWKEETEQKGDIDAVAKTLDEDHYGLKYPKGRICDGIAPKILNPEGKSQILCFVGPPGVGKTSLAKSIARALGRKLIIMSVGGIRDEAQIRGHRVTYIGALPGQILKLIRRCGTKDPVFVIDEIDKISHSSTSSGDPESAMLEVLDPEQNYAFTDHYLDCAYDLSKVMFIATANMEDGISPSLRDRMDIITLPGYLEDEKTEIAKKYLIPKWMQEVGLLQNKVTANFSDGIIRKLIRGYTREAGVRKLENLIAAISRKITTLYLRSRTEGNPIDQFMVDDKMTENFLGPMKFTNNKARPTKIGQAIGLAWTPVGGDILCVQSVMYPRSAGKKTFARTGMQGDVMKEADEVAMTLNKNRLKAMHPDLLKEWRRDSIHLHIPEGAIPKDGPSAGITVFMALHSLAIKKPIRELVAMTGEIDLGENVLPVGGIREKVVAAANMGIREIFLPKENERNLYDIPDSAKEKLQFHFVTCVQEVIDKAF